MIAAWMAYALTVAVLAAGTAGILDVLLRSHRKPTRWVWFGGMTFGALWPLWAAFRPANVSAPAGVPNAPMVTMDPLTLQVGSRSLWHVLETPLVIGWILSSVLLAVLGVALLIRTRRLRRKWVLGEARGRSVLYSEEWGPAVVGFFDTRIVLPRWCRTMEEDGLQLILDHEAEHLRAGDIRLLILAGIPPILLPWSLPLWWMWHRLRLAVEGDCDLRVLRKNPRATRAYLELLLEVGRRFPEGGAAAAMLSEPERTLERRIKIMTMPFPRKPFVRGALLVTVGLILVVVACLAPAPMALDDEAELPAVNAVAQEGTLADKPALTPFTVRPDIKNRTEVARAMEQAYPPLLRDAGIGGTATVWFYIDKTGAVKTTRINESSGHQALDDAALRVADGIEFTPALNKDEAVPVWISLPITFSVKAGSATEGKAPVRAPSEGADNAGEAIPVKVQSTRPEAVPYTVAPRLLNPSDLARAIGEEYPPLLKDAGIGGTTTLWFFIDKSGTVQNVIVNETSGRKELDQAALRMADLVRFSPALDGDDPVDVWISLPITFSVR